MDPLSITASCIAVAGASGAAVKGLKKIRDLSKLPDVLLSVINEIADLTLVVQDIRSSFRLHQDSSNISPASVAVIDQLLDRAQTSLLELDQVINYRLLSAPNRNGETSFSRTAWIFEEKRVLRLQSSLRVTRLDLAARFAALSFTRTVHLEVRLQELSLRIQRLQESHSSESQHIRHGQTHSTERLLNQFHSLEESHGRTHGALCELSNGFNTAKELVRQSLDTQDTPHQSTQHGRHLNRTDSVPRRPISPIVGLKVQQLAVSECGQNCSCQCHMRKQWRSHQVFDRVLGILFTGYSKAPNLAMKCDLASCGRHQRALISVIYVFPQWLLRQVLSMVLLYSKRNGIVASLKTLRPRSQSDIIWVYVSTGDVARVSALFHKREASPLDIGEISRTSLLQSAVDFMQPEMCKFLLHSGADPNMSVGGGISAAEQAWRIIWVDHGTPENLSLFRQLFGDNDPSFEYDFTALHRIILNLDRGDLKTHLQACSQIDINQRDASGLTSLHWAAWRGDSQAVEMLLQAGADVSFLSDNGAQPLHFAACRSNLRSIDFLLKYGADVNARDHLQSTPLISMFSSRSDAHPSCITRLIDSGAMVDAQDYQGATALVFAAQHVNTTGLETLLNYGAKIDLPSFDGEIALTIAVQSNRHTAISLLLIHGASLIQYTVSGRSLLHEAAETGDQETLRLLTCARIRGVKINHKNSDGKTAWDLARQRSDVTPEWRAAFADLIESVDENMLEPFLPTQPQVLSKRLSIPKMRISNLIRIVEDRVWEGAECVARFASRLPRLRVRKLFALLVACLAFLWYMMKS